MIHGTAMTMMGAAPVMILNRLRCCCHYQCTPHWRRRVGGRSASPSSQLNNSGGGGGKNRHSPVLLLFCLSHSCLSKNVRALLPPTVRHRWELLVMNYHKIMVICPYPFLVVINQLLSWIRFINDCICILTSSSGSYFFMTIYVIQKSGVTIILQIL